MFLLLLVIIQFYTQTTALILYDYAIIDSTLNVKIYLKINTKNDKTNIFVTGPTNNLPQYLQIKLFDSYTVNIHHNKTDINIQEQQQGIKLLPMFKLTDHLFVNNLELLQLTRDR
eukprot:204097_1